MYGLLRLLPPSLKARLRTLTAPFRKAPEFDEVALVHSILRTEHPGTMLDVGAHTGSSLARFAADGWRVIAFEPDPGNMRQLRARIQGGWDVIVDERAIDIIDGATRPLYTSKISTGISSLSPFHPSHVATAEVTTVRLDTYLADVAEVTVLKTDTEGHDLSVLETFPWTRLKPRAVVCEFEDRKTVPLGYRYDDLARYLVDLGYVVFVSEWWPIVEYGKRHRWRSMRRYPTALQSVDGWGNLIAVDRDLADSLGQRFRGFGAP